MFRIQLAESCRVRPPNLGPAVRPGLTMGRSHCSCRRRCRAGRHLRRLKLTEPGPGAPHPLPPSPRRRQLTAAASSATLKRAALSVAGDPSTTANATRRWAPSPRCMHGLVSMGMRLNKGAEKRSEAVARPVSGAIRSSWVMR